jgi:DnaJ-class molecular chaperone
MQRFDDFEYYTVLGLCFNASTREIHERFHDLCRVRHPDKFATCSDDIRKAADEEFKRINTAYHTLRDPIRGAEYDRARGNEGRRGSESSTPIPSSRRRTSTSDSFGLANERRSR